MTTGGGLRIEGTWLRSRLARRMFLMFCAAAFVPAIVVFWLTWRQAETASAAMQQRSLRDETRFVAFTLLSRLQSAAVVLADRADHPGMSATGGSTVFDAVVRVPTAYAGDIRWLPRVVVTPAGGRRPARVVVLEPRRQPGGWVLHAGVVAPRHLWRAEEDVVDGTRICARSGVQIVGCAGRVDAQGRHARYAWDLDLRGEFSAAPWRFEATRDAEPLAGPQVGMLALVAAGVLLLAVLMSLVQIRRTLVPLESLIARIRTFSGEDAGPAAAPARDEVVVLSTTFDAMQHRIGGQLDHLRALSQLDALILSRASLPVILAHVVGRLEALPGVARAVVTTDPAGSDAVRVGAGAHAAGLDPMTLVGQAIARPSAPATHGWLPVAADVGRDAIHGHVLPLETRGGAGAWAVLVASRTEWLPVAVLEAAHALADRVAIALALDGRERHLLHQARHDALTGLPNRLAAMEAMDGAAASRTPFAVVFMDLDRFKSINDGLGHALGDGLLAAVASRLRAALASQDLVARFGGDEFVVLAHSARDGAGIDDVRARIDAALAIPLVIDGHVLPVQYSAGVAFHPADGRTAGDLVRKADLAMYRAKQAGGGRCVLYAPDMDESARDEVALVAALRAALDAGQLEVHYQPRVDATTGRLTGMEALARWHDAQRGWVSPARFIPLAEAHGLIHALGAFVLRTACTQVAAWRAAGLAPGSVAVNVSSAQLRSGTLVPDIEGLLEDTGATWSDLEIEITESMLIADVDASASQLQALRDRGTTVAIDDFGTGYSSLAYLARLPLDTIKIDRAFVIRLDEPGTAPVVKSVLALAAGLGKRVITEGVETDAQLRTLRSWGCEVFQGYLFHRPMPADAVQRLLESTRDTQPA